MSKRDGPRLNLTTVEQSQSCCMAYSLPALSDPRLALPVLLSLFAAEAFSDCVRELLTAEVDACSLPRSVCSCEARGAANNIANF